MTYRRDMKVRDVGKIPEFENNEDEDIFMQYLLDSLVVKTWLQRRESEKLEQELER